MQLKAAFSASPKNLAAGLVASVLIAAGILWSAAEHDAQLIVSVAGWVAALWILLIRGIRIGIRFHSMERSADEALIWGRRITINGMLAAAVWGLSSWIFLPGSSPYQEAWIIIALSMILSGGAGAQAIYRPLLNSFVIVTTGVFSAGLFWQGDRFYILVGLGFLLYAGVLLMFARDHERAVRASIELGFEKEKLLEGLTEQHKAAEQARSEAEEARHIAEQADRAKTNFLAAASHDLRQPLHALTQYVYHLKRQTADPALGETIEKIKGSLDAMEDLLNALLDFSKFAVGAVKPLIVPVYLPELFNRLELQLKPLAMDKGLALTLRADHLSVESDEVLLERIMRNLLINAIRYTTAGSVLVRARRRPDGRIEVQVFDTGLGIAKDKKTRIFEDYYQIDNKARDRRKGLGLGLAIVREISALLRCTIRVTSVPGKGSVFSVALPAATTAREARRSRQATKEGPDYVAGALVVLIDDDPQARDGMATTLRNFGCRVIEASSSIDALSRLQNQEFAPQLVVSDYRLGDGETGLDAIAMLRDNQRAQFGDEFHLPALLITGDTAPAELEKATYAGYAMLHKPVSAQAMYRALNEALSQLAEGVGEGKR